MPSNTTPCYGQLFVTTEGPVPAAVVDHGLVPVRAR